MNPRALLVAGLAVAALAGLAMAAEGQEESFLKPSDLESGFSDRSLVSGALVPLTALLVASAGTAMAALLARVPVRDRFLPLGAVFLGTYIVVLILQTAMFNYHAIDVARFAQYAVSLVLANEAASPSIYIGPMALLLGAALAISSGAQRLAGGPRAPTDTRHATHLFVAALVLATPLLAVLAIGSIRLLLALPDSQPATLPYLIVLPLSALAASVLLGIGVAKAWHLGHAVRDPRLAPVAREAWEGLRRIEWSCLGALTALAFLATLLRPVEHSLLEAGRVFAVNARTHTQAQVLLLIVLVPWMTLHQSVLRTLRDARAGDTGSRSAPLVTGFMIAAGAGLAGAAAATWWLEGALWPWLFCSLPLAIFGLTALRPELGLLPALSTAAVLWAIGNTISGTFQLATNSQLRYDVGPGMLALWRAMALLLVAWAVARAARARARGMRQAVAWPMTMGLASSVGLIIFFDFSFSAWINHEQTAEFVGIGSLMASLDPPVRGVLHAISGLGAFVSGLAIARLERPDWFQPGDPQASPLPPIPAAE